MVAALVAGSLFSKQLLWTPISAVNMTDIVTNQFKMTNASFAGTDKNGDPFKIRATSGRQEYDNPDIIILDYQIPLFNGVTLMKMIQQNTGNEKVPFIILSGTLDQKAIMEFCPYKPAAVLAKPVEKEVLLEHIEQALLENEQDTFEL